MQAAATCYIIVYAIKIRKEFNRNVSCKQQWKNTVFLALILFSVGLNDLQRTDFIRSISGLASNVDGMGFIVKV
jgi:hypothetical protein